MGVDDAAQARVLRVEPDVMDGVDAGTQPALHAVGHALGGHGAALEVDDHQVLGPERVVVDAAGLDEGEAPRAMEPARVAAVHRHQARAGELHVGPPDLLPQGGELAAHGLGITGSTRADG